MIWLLVKFLLWGDERPWEGAGGGWEGGSSVEGAHLLEHRGDAGPKYRPAGRCRSGTAGRHLFISLL